MRVVDKITADSSELKTNIHNPLFQRKKVGINKQYSIILSNITTRNLFELLTLNLQVSNSENVIYFALKLLQAREIGLLRNVLILILCIKLFFK